MGCIDKNFSEFIDRYKSRKTLPKKETVKLMKDMILNCKYTPHYPGCYLPGQTPPKLCKEYVKENELIEKFNDHIEKLAKQINQFHSL